MKDKQLNLRTSPGFRELLADFSQLTDGSATAAVYLGIAFGGALLGALQGYQPDGFPEFWQDLVQRLNHAKRAIERDAGRARFEFPELPDLTAGD